MSLPTFLPQGALIHSFPIASHNIILSQPTASLYATHNHAYIGETIGRTTNRIRRATLVLNHRTYALHPNDAPNTLHGGALGWGKRIFGGPKTVTRNGCEATQFTYRSEDGEEGYPCTVECRVWYISSVANGVTELEIEYEVENLGPSGDTVVGVTNHSYFNLDPSAPTVDGMAVNLCTNKYLPVDDTQIPTGRIEEFPGLPKAGEKWVLGKENVIDHCFVVNEKPETIPLDTRSLPLKFLARLEHPKTGIVFELRSTEPAFQLYTGEGIEMPDRDAGGEGGAEGTVSKDSREGEIGMKKFPRKGLAIEPSRYVDCAGREEWMGMCRVAKGEVWGARSVWRGWKE